MKKLKMILTGILMISMLFHLSLFSVFAAEEYTYTVTFYAGNRGTFTGVDGLSVVSTGKVQIDHQGDKVVVGGLKAGDTLSFDLQQGAVRVGDDGKYYVTSWSETDTQIIQVWVETTPPEDISAEEALSIITGGSET